MSQRFSALSLFLYVTLPLYILDQITKFAILKNFPNPNEVFKSVPVIDGFFNLVRVHNTGVAFGAFNQENYTNPVMQWIAVNSNIFFGIVALFALIFIAVMWKKDAFPTRVGKLAIALLVSGIFGNVTDRLLHGYVVDFLDFHIGTNHWPSFNVADSCICVSATLLFISAFQKDPEPEVESA